MAAAIPELLGLTLGEGVAFALGTALAPVLRPLTQEYENVAWSEAVNLIGGDSLKPLNVGDLAGIVAESVEALGWGRDEAAKQGITQRDFDALFHAEQDAPGFGTLLQLLRRGLIDAAEFEHGLRKAKFEGRWDTALESLREVLLSPADLAMMRQQGFIEPARQHSESALQGVNAERADLLFEASGLPPGIETALEMLRREIVNAETFAQIVREGHTKTKYTDELLALKQRVLSATEYATLHLKGWISEQAMNTGGALTGYDADAMHLLYLARGRPAAPGQMATAAARGIDGPKGRPVDREQFIEAVAQSDVRPEYGPMLWDARFLYPPLFQITRLVQAGAIDAATAKDWATKDRYPPEVVNALHDYWTQPTATKADSHEAKAQTQLWGTLHRAYMAGDVTDDVATEKLAQAGVSAATVPAVLATWKHEREIQRQRITPAQLKKAVAKAVTNPATGAPWSKDDALAELLSRGWSSQDANTFLDTPAGK